MESLGGRLSSLKTCLNNLLLAVQITSLVFAPDGRTLYSGDDDGVISVWDMDQAKRMHILSGHSGPVWSLAASHGTGGLIASGAHHALHVILGIFFLTMEECP